MKNKILVSIFILSLLFLLPTPLFSLEQRTQTEQYFMVEYSIGEQSVWNNSIPLNVYITPKSNFSKVEITFNHGAITEVRYTGPQFFPVNAGETYQVQARVYPKEQGIHHITINSIAWEYDTNYTSSTSANIQIDENLQIVPQTQTYKTLNTLKYVLIVFILIAIIAITYFLVIKNLGKIKKWLEPEY